jgi:hypothetical protein
MMKKFLFALTLSLLSVVATNAQFTKFGGGLAYGTGVYFKNESFDVSHKTGNPAIIIKGIYELNLPIHFSPSVSIFMPRVTKETISMFTETQTISAFLFDFNGHYVFNSLDRFEFYALTGLNVTVLRNKWKYEFEGQNEGEDSDASMETAPGLNLGLGGYMKLTEQIDLFAEAKYIFSKRHQVMLTAGIMLNLEWLKKNESGGL